MDPFPTDGQLRADAQRSADALVRAARELFATRGVEVTTREIATAAGVGMGTLYRRFPRRADLIGAVFMREFDELAAASLKLAAEYPPFEALGRWVQLYVALLATKRGLARAISSDDPVYVGIAAQFDQRLHASAQALYAAAAQAEEVPRDLDASDVLTAVSALSMSALDQGADHAARLSSIFLQGLRATC